MKELLLQYAEYNVWANRQIIDAILKLDEDLLQKEIISSFRSVKDTVVHIWSAENVWLQRLRLAEHPAWAQEGFTGTTADACFEWQKASEEFVTFVQKQYDDRSFTHVLQYYDLKKMPHKTPVYQVLQHVFNHTTSHRGQLITMLRQLGVTEIPRTDFIIFARKVKVNG